MEQQESRPVGPDLTQGIPSGDLADGGMLLGHVGDDTVLVVRRGSEVFAVAAACTHYGGPLAEGLLGEDTIQCPLHHACFSLRTGEAVRAPALNPLSCWNVVTDDGRIRVTDKRRDVDGATPSPAARHVLRRRPGSVVIVGGGAAGNAAAEMLRRCGYDGPVTLVSDDRSGPYDRPNVSKDYLAGSAPPEWIPLRGEDFYRQHDIALRLRTHVTGIDTKAHRITIDGGEALAYGTLLLATGADPIRLSIAGADGPQVHYLRRLEDADAIIRAATDARTVAVVGASFIGLEAAASLRTRGLDVHVIAPEHAPLERVLGAELGALVRKEHERHGVTFHLGTRPQRIERGSVSLENGTTVPADLVVVGVGVRPAVALAEGAGIATDRGVSVNEYLETNAPDVFAAGDIARWLDQRLGQRIRVEHWVVAERQGQVAARNILGAGEAFRDVPFFWSMHYDLAIRYVGYAEAWDAVDVDGSIADRSCVVRYRQGERTLAAATINRDLDALRIARTLEEGLPA